MMNTGTIINKKMLTVDQAKKYLHKNLSKLMSLYGLEQWKITVAVRLDVQNDHGDVNIKPEYCRAHINLYIEGMEEIEELEYTLKHELMHCVHSPFSKVLYVIEEMLEGDQVKVAAELFRQAAEETVVNIEKISVA